jgi:hypothetical protein
MKKKNLLQTVIFMIAFIMMNQFANAQWQNKASGFPTQRNIVELITAGDKVAWGVAGEAFKPIWEVAPFNDFTRTTDGGNHWIPGKVTAFPDYILVGIAPLSATLCYGSLANFNTGETKIVKTTDGGITWIEQMSFDFGQLFGFFADIYFFNENDGLVYGDPTNGYFTIFTTHDGGAHWTRVPQANTPAALTDEFSYVFSSEGIGNTFWTVSTSGRIWKTTDKGLHWNAYTTDETNIEFSNLKMRDSLNGLWGVHGELYKTDDGGISWAEVEYSGTWFTNDLAYVPGTEASYVSTGAHDFPGYAPNNALHGIGTSYSVDDGNTWITIDTAVEHISLAMVNSYTGFTGAVNTNGSTGMFKYNGSALGYSCGNNLTSMCHKGNTICVANASISNLLSKGDELGACSSSSPSALGLNGISRDDLQFGIYPNPVSSSAIISFLVTGSQKVSLQLFDVNGKLVSTLADNFFEEGQYQIVFDAGKINAGIYFLKMQTGETLQALKLIVTK